MINLILYNLSNQIMDGRYIHQKQHTILVVPNPAIADEVRSFSKYDQSWEVLTVSKYINNQLEGIEVCRKSEIFFELAGVWKIKINQDFNQFEKVFYFFTELRSLSLNFNLIKEAIDQYFEKEIIFAIELFWNYLEQRGLIDEQLGHHLLTEKMRSPDINSIKQKKSNIILCGFKFLSGSQVDLFSAIGIRNDLYITLPKEVLQNCKSYDWPRWFDYENEEVLQNEIVNQHVLTYRFPKSRMAEIFNTLELKKAKEVYICSKQIDFEHIHEIPISNKKSKVQFNYFEIAAQEIFNQLNDLIYFADNNLNSLIVKINTTKEQYLLSQKFIPAKVAQLFCDSFSAWGELSDELLDLTQFDLKVIYNIVLLDLPRVFLINQEVNGDGCNIVDVSNTLFLDNQQDFLICANSNYSSIYSNSNIFPEELSQKLRAIGPLRRGSLDTEFLFVGIKNKLSCQNSKLLIEDQLEESDPFWKKIMAYCTLKTKNLSTDLTKPARHFSLDCHKYYDQKANISPTKLQTYIDCPRKFYINYIERLAPRIELNNTLRPFDLGLLEHLVIESYFKHDLTLFDSDYHKLVATTMLEHLQRDKITITKSEYNRAFTEVFYFSKNGITFLQELKKKFSDIKYQFEKSVGENNIIGRADLIVTGSSIGGVIDFKRSKASIPTKAQIDQFKKIQTWFYLSRIERTSKVMFFGYLNLSDISNSLLCSDSDIFDLRLKAKVVDDFEESISNYSNIELKTIEQIRNDRDFFAKPLDKQSCQYCSLSNICSKGLSE